MPGRSLVSGRYLVSNTGRVWTPWYLMCGVRPQDCVAAYQPAGAHSLRESYTNLNNPARFNAAPGVAPTWDIVNGWKFNGTTQYLTTGVIPNIPICSAIMRYSSLTLGSAKTLFGEYSGSRANSFLIQAGSVSTMTIYNGHTADYPPALVTGVYGIAGKIPYRNGLAEASLAAGGSATTQDIYIGALNLGGATQFASVYCAAFAYYSVTLTARQVLAITYAMNHCTEPMYNGWLKPTEMFGWKAAVGGLSIPVAMATYFKRRTIDNG